MSVRSLILGGVEVPLLAALEIRQAYEPLQATNRRRMADGSAKQRTRWSGKRRTTLSGRGVIPLGLDALDYSQPLTLSCIEGVGICSASPNIVLPAARRADAGSEPFGRARIGHEWHATPVNMVGHTAELTPVAGAIQYQAVYFPELLVFADPPQESKGGRGPDFSWQLTAEEV